MGAKSISISEEVYARLEAEKGGGESFNDILNPSAFSVNSAVNLTMSS